MESNFPYHKSGSNVSQTTAQQKEQIMRELEQIRETELEAQRELDRIRERKEIMQQEDDARKKAADAKARFQELRLMKEKMDYEELNQRNHFISSLQNNEREQEMMKEAAKQQKLDEEEAQGTEFAIGVKQTLKMSNPFKAATRPGQYRNMWFTEQECTGQQVLEVVNALIENGVKVHLILGVHGDFEGNLIDEQNYWQLEKNQFEHHQDNIHMVSMQPHQQVIIPLDKSRSVVFGMCYGRQVFEREIATCASRGIRPREGQYKMLMD